MGVFEGTEIDFRKSIGLLGWLGIVILLLGTTSFAQQSTGTILGVVKDSSGGLVPQAKVTVVNTDTNQSRIATTGEDGAFRFPALPTGHYSLKIEKEGFKTETETALTLDVTQELVVNSMLEVGTSTQEVTVTGEAPLVNTTNSTVGALVNEQMMSDLPLNGRNYVDLTTLQPGIQKNIMSPGGGAGYTGTSFSSNGSPIRSNFFSLDGALMMDQTQTSSSSISGDTLGVDGIKEYKVVTHSFGAEYGLVMGSQVQMVSKGGTNQWHGDVFEYFRNNDMDARNFFDQGPSPAVLQRNNFGGSGGGPIRKDKTFFYAVYEGLRENQGMTVLDTVLPAACHQLVNPGTTTTTLSNPSGCASGLTTAIVPEVIQPWLAQYPLPNVGSTGYQFATAAKVRDDFGQIRIDQQISAADSLFGRYTISDGSMLNPADGTALVFSGAAYPQYSFDGVSRNQFLSIGETHIFTPTVLNQARVSFSRMRLLGTNVWNTTSLNPQGELIGPGYSLVTGQEMGDLSIGGGISAFGPSSNWPITRVMEYFTISDDVFYTHGRHAFKFGTLLNRDYSIMDANFSRDGALTFSGIATFMTGTPSSFKADTALPGFAAQSYYPIEWNTLGFYAQDDFRATQHLTLNLGVRYEIMTDFHGMRGIQSFIPDMLTSSTYEFGPYVRNYTLGNWSPRLGFAWDIFGDGKTSLRGGFGIYYDVGNLPLSSIAGGMPPYLGQSLLQYAPGTVVSDPVAIPPASFSNGLSGVDHNLKQPYSVQENLTLERQLPFAVGISIAYVGNHGVHVMGQVEGNPCIPESVTNGIPNWSNSALTTCPLGRVNLAFGSSQWYKSDSTSFYNALQVAFTKRLSHGLQITGSYVYSRATDDTASGQGGGDCQAAGMGNPVYTFNLRQIAYGPSCYDLRNVWHVNALYHLPNIKTNDLVSKVTNGWWVGGILTVQGGFPFTPTTSTNRSLSGNRAGAVSDFVDVATAADVTTCTTTPSLCSKLTPVPFNPNTVITGNPSQWFNPNMFDLGPVGYLGDAPRGLLRGPGVSNFDFSANKDTALPFLGEKGVLQFRAEIFNIFNHANFGFPSGAIFSGTVTDSGLGSEAPSKTAGQITTTATTSRQIQLALKVIF